MPCDNLACGTICKKGFWWLDLLQGSAFHPLHMEEKRVCSNLKGLFVYFDEVQALRENMESFKLPVFSSMAIYRLLYLNEL